MILWGCFSKREQNNSFKQPHYNYLITFMSKESKLARRNEGLAVGYLSISLSLVKGCLLGKSVKQKKRKGLQSGWPPVQNLQDYRTLKDYSHQCTNHIKLVFLQRKITLMGNVFQYYQMEVLIECRCILLFFTVCLWVVLFMQSAKTGPLRTCMVLMWHKKKRSLTPLT